MGVLENKKHEMFCQELFKTTPPMNGRQAYKKAYGEVKDSTADNNASRLLKNVQVAARVKELQEAAVKRLEITVDLLNQMSLQVYAQSIKPEPIMEWDYENKEMVESDKFQFDSKGANGAIANMMKLNGLGLEKREISGQIGVQIVDDIK